MGGKGGSKGGRAGVVIMGAVMGFGGTGVGGDLDCNYFMICRLQNDEASTGSAWDEYGVPGKVRRS